MPSFILVYTIANKRHDVQNIFDDAKFWEKYCVTLGVYVPKTVPNMKNLDLLQVSLLGLQKLTQDLTLLLAAGGF